MKDTNDLLNVQHLAAERLEEIALFLKNHYNTLKEPGLLNGKMGVALFMFQYSGFSSNSNYEDLASLLIDEIGDKIETVTSVEFRSGLTGIGWGIECLIHNGFVDGDSNAILKELDEVVFNNPSLPVQINQPSCFWGQGLYFCSRLFNSREKEMNESFYNEGKYLDILLLEIERFFIHRRFLDFSYPVADLNFLLSVFYFLSKVQHLVPRSNRIDKIRSYMNAHLKVCASQNTVAVDDDGFYQISGNGNLRSAFKNPNGNNGLQEYPIESLIQYAHHSLFLQAELNQIELQRIKDTLTAPCNESSWRRLTENLNENNLSVEKGIAGIGIALMNYLKTTGNMEKLRKNGQ